MKSSSLNNKGTLTILGSGIKFLSHLTKEAEAYIFASKKILYLLNDPAMEHWVKNKNSYAESLDKIYFKYRNRIDSYNQLTQYILKILKKEKNLCVLFYGHPTVYVRSAIDALIKAKKEGYSVEVLPGISAEACLFADLHINPGLTGYQTFEATDFIINKRIWDPRSYLSLLQISKIGCFQHLKNLNKQKKFIALLLEYLLKFYPTTHKVILYQASQYPHLKPFIKKFNINSLFKINIPDLAILLIPPITKTSSKLI